MSEAKLAPVDMVATYMANLDVIIDPGDGSRRLMFSLSGRCLELMSGSSGAGDVADDKIGKQRWAVNPEIVGRCQKKMAAS